MATRPTNEQKAAMWEAYRQGKPIRTPVIYGVNPRVIVLDPKLNHRGYTFAQLFADPQAHVMCVLEFARHMHTVIHKYSDWPVGLPDEWVIGQHLQNVYEAASLGAPVEFPPNQVPGTEPILTDANKESIFALDIRHPLDHGFYRDRLAFWREMEKVCHGLKFEGRPVRLAPWMITGTDGPVTVACNLRGTAFLTDLLEDPDYADRLMDFITDAAIETWKAFAAYWGDRFQTGAAIADDSCAMLGPEMYVERILPRHLRLYEAKPANLARSIHLCGDATRLMPLIHRDLNVMSFDTGFPVDHGKLRRDLGPKVEILGGPPVSLLLEGTPDQVYSACRAILQSGVKEGGRFMLREGNNLPPACPEANLDALYQASLDFGGY